jgi:hypothetical protein
MLVCWKSIPAEINHEVVGVPVLVMSLLFLLIGDVGHIQEKINKCE